MFNMPTRTLASGRIKGVGINEDGMQRVEVVEAMIVRARGLQVTERLGAEV